MGCWSTWPLLQIEDSKESTLHRNRFPISESLNATSEQTNIRKIHGNSLTPRTETF